MDNTLAAAPENRETDTHDSTLRSLPLKHLTHTSAHRRARTHLFRLFFGDSSVPECTCFLFFLGHGCALRVQTVRVEMAMLVLGSGGERVFEESVNLGGVCVCTRA